MLRSTIVDYSHYILRSTIVDYSHYILRSTIIDYSHYILRSTIVDYYALKELLDFILQFCIKKFHNIM